MNNLIKTEWLKIRNYRAFWWMMVMSILAYPGLNWLGQTIYNDIINDKNKTADIAKMILGNPFTFPEVWHTSAFFSAWFIFIPSIIVIMFITNEYTYKTHRQNIIDGWSRNQFMTSKLIDVAIISFLITLVYFLTALIIGLMNRGDSDAQIWEGSKYIFLFALQTFAQLSIAFLIAFLARKAFIALGIFIFYFLILENILVGLASWKANDIGRFLPLEVSDRIIPVPAFFGKLNQEGYADRLNLVNTHIVLTIVYVAATWLLCYYLNKKRDL